MPRKLDIISKKKKLQKDIDDEEEFNENKEGDIIQDITKLEIQVRQIYLDKETFMSVVSFYAIKHNC